MTKPIFADVFADQWPKLPAVMRAHYANRPFSHDRVTVEGQLDVYIHPLLKPLAPLMAALGLLTPWDGYEWVRYGDDALLVDIDTGEVIRVEYDLFD